LATEQVQTSGQKRKVEKNAKAEVRESVVVRLAGDSGDGMQIVGDRFADTCAMTGNDICTFPDFPSEIRAPAGSLPGVSGFQIHFGCKDILTLGDSIDCLVVMNPAALKVNINDLVKGGLLIVNSSSFAKPDLDKAAYDSNPLDDKNLYKKYNVVKIDAVAEVKEALKDCDLKNVEKVRSKNFFMLGLLYNIYSKSMEITESWIKKKWKFRENIADANTLALRRGFSYSAENDITSLGVNLKRFTKEDGIYRKINGNEAVALGLVAAAENSWRDLVLGSYPITPATPILETLSKYKNFNIKTIQAEDEIAAVGAALGASYAGSLGVTTTSGPGLALKTETIGLGVMAELPLVVVNVQRAGPSTGLPTKTEQADLMQAIFGRNGESPVVVLAAASARDCFDTTIDACRLALQFRTPVILLTDSYMANGSETWRVPSPKEIPDISVEPIRQGEDYIPYKRDPKTLARRLAIPGRPGFEHRIGGLEKTEDGSVSYDPINHEKMVKIRAEKIENIANFVPPIKIHGDEKGDILLIGWGSTFGPIRTAVDNLRRSGFKIGHAHLRFIHPMQPGVKEAMDNFEHILIPEGNLGQLAFILRAKYLRDVTTFSKVQGLNFTVVEIENKIKEMLNIS
jgi:2-oxoglutarate/2-oxoacid ferredoxin oxidoreductase subunit alpha